MKVIRWLLIASAIFAVLPACAQIASFKHIVVIVQENRTPDNLFHELCNQPPASCTDKSNNTQYDIKTDNWQNYQSLVTPKGVDLAIKWDIDHYHDPDWTGMCDQQNGACLMDGAASENCSAGVACPSLPEFTYVQRYTAGAEVDSSRASPLRSNGVGLLDRHALAAGGGASGNK